MFRKRSGEWAKNRGKFGAAFDYSCFQFSETKLLCQATIKISLTDASKCF